MHPEELTIAYFQKDCRHGANMGEGSIMGSFGGARVNNQPSEGLFFGEIFRSIQLSFDRNYTEPPQCSQKLITETSSDAR